MVLKFSTIFVITSASVASGAKAYVSGKRYPSKSCISTGRSKVSIKVLSIVNAKKVSFERVGISFVMRSAIVSFLSPSGIVTQLSGSLPFCNVSIISNMVRFLGRE